MEAFSSADTEPQILADIIEGAKDPEQKIDMDLELLDIDALDTGRHHALVIVDPEDKRNIKGFLHLAVVTSQAVDAAEQQLYYTWGSIHYRRIVGLTELLNALNEYTDITGDIWSGYTFASRELFNTPWILVSTFVAFRLAESEAQNIGKYLTGGGFLFADNYWASSTNGYRHLRQMFKDALATQGVLFEKHWGFEKLPNDHPIYHCYFDFEGPPMGNDAGVVSGGLHYPGMEVLFYLEGVPVEGEMAGIVSNKCYLSTWRNVFRKNNVRQLQFGVNTIVFALTREGSITHRLMDSIK